MAKKIFRSVFLVSLLVLLLSFLIIMERICSVAESIKKGVMPNAPSGIMLQCLAAFALAILVAAFLARSISEKIVKPLRQIDPDHPLDGPGYLEYPEIHPLLKRLQDYKAGILGICDAERKASFCPDRVVII